MLDEALDSAETFREREEMALLQERARFREPTAQHRADDSAEATMHLALRELVMRMTCEPRIDHAIDLRMLLEVLRDGERVRAVTLHAKRERLDAAKGEEGIERPRHTADRVLQV